MTSVHWRVVVGAFVASLVMIFVLWPRAPVSEDGPARAPFCPRAAPSRLATELLADKSGVEIGPSGQNPFGLRRTINVDYAADNAPWTTNGCEVPVVHIAAPGDDLPFRDGVLEYVVSSHVIEHFFDPIKTLREWRRVLKPRGLIFIIAPHMDRTFDQTRPATTVAELVARAEGSVRPTDYARPVTDAAIAAAGFTALELVQGRPLAPGWEFMSGYDHHSHWSAWRTADFVELVKVALPDARVLTVQDVDDKVGNGFTVVIEV